MILKKTHIAPGLVFGLIVFLLIGCSQKKNKWLNRNFHAMGAYYNILYNGNLALEDGKQAIRDQYEDNFWYTLPVERKRTDIDRQARAKASTPSPSKNSKTTPSRSVSSSSPVARMNASASSSRGAAKKGRGSNQASLGNSTQFQQTSDALPESNGSFKRAEEKATKAIQKHNMLINGTEYNYKMDEAFLLLGKARYYDERYLPAIEAFNYVLTKYPKSDLLARAKIWREKTLLKLGNYDQALEDLKKLLKETDLGKLEDQDYANASAAMAQAYLDLNEPEKALEPLDTAINYTGRDEEKGRYLFIKGQLYDSLQQHDEANASYDKVIELNRRQPRKYLINAHLKKAQNYNIESDDPKILEEHLFELAEDRENRPFLDKIYYEIAQYYRHRDKLPFAVNFYNRSLRTGTQDRDLLWRTYLILGNMNFDKAEYKQAGKYYDSTLTNLNQNTRKYRDINRKRENLEDVIKYEDIAAKNDSILRLVKMNPAERLRYFTDITDSLKTDALAKAENENRSRDNLSEQNLFGRQKSTAGGSSATFYFYNENQRKQGVQNFRQRWGNRPLQDNWRYLNSGGASTNRPQEKTEGLSVEEQIAADPKYDPKTYLDQIPSDPQVIDSISDERNFAYYQLGIIYKDQFGEYSLAIDKLTRLLENNPEERLIAPSKYYLYKIYETLGRESEKNKWKQNILTEHSDSRYASILNNPQSLKSSQDSPQAIYEGIYKKYKRGDFQQVIKEADREIERFTGNSIVPKLELLKAIAKGRLYGYKTYKEALDYVALTYPQSPEGKKAEKMLSETLPAIQDSSFVDGGKSFKLIYPFEVVEKAKAVALKKKIDKAISEEGLSELSTSIDTYDTQRLFLTIHGLDTKMGAEGFGALLNDEKKITTTHQPIAISSENYSRVLIHKLWQKYKQEQTE